ncbi:MAG: RluA family pseudouridine synthase [Clostridia bacterium]|nr:RluA family pseudouridine synthase [Clostridia bacterium]
MIKLLYKGAKKTDRISHTVTKSEDGMSVRALIAKNFALSTKTLRRIKRVENGITLDGKWVTVAETARVGQTLECLVADVAPKALDAAEIELDILFEDEWICVVNKPGGLVTHPSSLAPDRPSVAGAYVASHPGTAFHPVTRLDSGTSGVMLIAKSGYVHSLFSTARGTKGLKKEYSAVCDGILEHDAGAIDAPIAREPGSVIKRRVSPAGKSAKTLFEVLGRYDGRTLVKLILLTGRTHQIRVHLAWAGYPVTGDFLYGKEDRDLITRPALHSKRLEAIHPVTGEKLVFEAPLPPDMEKLLK